MRRALLRSAAVLGCVALATRILACDPSSAAAVLKDTDGDGLSDADERSIYGTSPTMPDTDGDGFSDYTEIVTNVFDPVSSPLRFNPRVADVPMLEIEIASIPYLTLNLVDINGESRTYEVSQTYENSTSVTQGSTVTNTQGASVSVSDTFSRQLQVSREVSLTVPFDDTPPGVAVVDVDGGTDGGIRRRVRPVLPDAGVLNPDDTGDPITVSLTNGVQNQFGNSETFQQTRSAEVSISFTAQQTREFSQAVTLAESYSQDHELQASGGTLEVLAFIRNRSNLPFQVTNLFISGSFISSDGNELPAGNLEISTALSNFQSFSMAPGQEIGPVNFFKENLTLEQAVAMLQDVTAIRLRIGAYELRDANARPYVFDVPTIRARTASINIDYGGQHPPEWYMVATNLDPARPGVSVSRALGEILRVPFECNPDAGRVTIRGVGLDEDGGGPGGRWCIFHRHRNEGEDQVVPYCSDTPSFDCNLIELRAGDLVRLAWITK